MIIHPELTGLGNWRLHLPSSSTVGLSSACHLLTLNHICVNLQLRSDLIFNIIEQMLTIKVEANCSLLHVNASLKRQAALN